jgi:hypothetical protein
MDTNGYEYEGGEDGFNEYRRLILSELKRLGRDQETHSARIDGQMLALREMFTLKLDSLQAQLSDLRSEVKAGEKERKALSMVWGLLGGAVPVFIWLVYQVMGG